jgi:hypothetical protein
MANIATLGATAPVVFDFQFDFSAHRGRMPLKECQNSEHSGIRARQSSRFFCAHAMSMAGRATDTRPRKGEEVHRLCSVLNLPATSRGVSERLREGSSNSHRSLP